MVGMQASSMDAFVLAETQKSIETRTVAQFNKKNTIAPSQKNAEQLGGNPFESARVNLNARSSNLSLDGGALEALFALYQDEKNTLFTQWGVNRRKATNTFNIGLGHRWLISDEWRLGYNLFYDALCDHGPYHRLGLGFEAQQDYLRLAFNGYYPLSSWRDIGDNKLYALRPAREVSFIVQAYLPSAPQLGAKLSAERYFDRNTQLLGQAHSRSAMKLGLNYTPIPLLKVGYDYRIGRHDGNKRHELQLMLSYRFGIPMAHQLDSSRVRQFNALAGSWLDPALRNHQVVLARKDSTLLNQLTNVNPQLYQRLLAPNLYLPKGILEVIDSLPLKVKMAVLDISTMGNWNNAGGDLAPGLLSELLPDNFSLRIVDAAGNTLHGMYFNPGRPNVLTLKLEGNHYQPQVNGAFVEAGGQGDCLYNSVLVGLGRANNLAEVRALRAQAAWELVNRPDLWDNLEDDNLSRKRL